MLPCSPSECNYETWTENTAQLLENSEKQTATGRWGRTLDPPLSFQEGQQDSTNPTPGVSTVGEERALEKPGLGKGEETPKLREKR